MPLLAFSLLIVLHAPRIFATAYDSLGRSTTRSPRRSTAGRRSASRSSSLQLLTLTLPALGLALTFSRVGRRAGTTAWSWSDGRPERRAVVVSAATAAVALAAFTWWPNGDYRPIQPGEHGTVQGGLRSVAAIPGGRPSVTPKREHERRRTPNARRLDRPQEGRAPAVETRRPVRRRAAKRSRNRRDATPTPTATSAPGSGGTAGVTDAVSGATDGATDGVTDGVTDTATGQTDAATRSVPAVPTVTVPAVPTAVPTVSAPGLP